jgi:hypothetical protein
VAPTTNTLLNKLQNSK